MQEADLHLGGSRAQRIEKNGMRFLAKPREVRRRQPDAGHTRQSRRCDLVRHTAKHCAGGVRRNCGMEYRC